MDVFVVEDVAAGPQAGVHAARVRGDDCADPGAHERAAGDASGNVSHEPVKGSTISSCGWPSWVWWRRRRCRSNGPTVARSTCCWRPDIRSGRSGRTRSRRTSEASARGRNQTSGSPLVGWIEVAAGVHCVNLPCGADRRMPTGSAGETVGHEALEFTRGVRRARPMWIDVIASVLSRL